MSHLRSSEIAHPTAIYSRGRLANGTIPAIDVLASVSRVRSRVTSKNIEPWLARSRAAWPPTATAEDLIQIGAYTKVTMRT